MSWIISLKKICDKCDPKVPKLYGGMPSCRNCFDSGFTFTDFTLEEFLNLLNQSKPNNGNQ